MPLSWIFFLSGTIPIFKLPFHLLNVPTAIQLTQILTWRFSGHYWGEKCYFWNAAQKYVAAEPAPAPPGLPEGGEVQGAALRSQLHVPGGGQRRTGGAQQLSGRRGGAQSQRYRFSVSIPDQHGESHKGKENHVRWAMMLFLEKGLMWRTDISSRNKHLEERFCQKNFFCHLQYRTLVFFVKKRPASGSHDPYCY